jgi:hypothetical protein
MKRTFAAGRPLTDHDEIRRIRRRVYQARSQRLKLRADERRQP